MDSSDPPLLPSSFGLNNVNGSSSPIHGGIKEENSNGTGAGGEGEAGGVVKANKGMILRKSVVYIRSVWPAIIIIIIIIDHIFCI